MSVNKAVSDYVARSNAAQGRILRGQDENTLELRRRRADFTPSYQYELFPEPTMIQRVLAFLKDLRK